ncbi:MAG: hypothetical protein AAGK02_13110 [Pseudomonadota bacterium]
MKSIKKRLAAVSAGLFAIAMPTAAAADTTYTYSYYECSFGVCQLVTCIVFEDEWTQTTQEICGPGGIGGF